MPCPVTAFGVKIASPGDAAMEMVIVREVIGEWNACHAVNEKLILLPLHREEKDPSSDLLITFYCNSLGSVDEPPSVAEEEIEQHLLEGKPALIYFSETRIDFTETDPLLQSGTFDEFKKRYMTATVDSYGDDKEFRGKFARHLEFLVRTHDYFKIDRAAPASASVPAATPKPLDPRRTGPLTPWAQTILIEACDDFEAYIGHLKVGDTLRIQANGKQLVEPGDPATIAKWEDAFQELLIGGYIRDAGCNGQLFQISTRGFEFLKTIGKSPVGYIAELGGM